MNIYYPTNNILGYQPQDQFKHNIYYPTLNILRYQTQDQCKYENKLSYPQ